MMYFMHSKTFQDDFIPNESEKSILDAQYILVSSRIRRRRSQDKAKNVLYCYSLLYPNSSVMMNNDEEDMKEEYFNQLDENIGFISSLVLGSIQEKYNIIFLCTKNEYKFPYFKWMQSYIYERFGYPIYEYKKYINGCGLVEYNADKVIKKCKKYLSKEKQRQYDKNLKTKNGRDKIRESFRSISKKKLKKDLEERNLYIEGMSKKEMLEMMDLFL